jgi:hypothetical protein
VEEDGVIPCPFPFPKEKDMPLAPLDDGGETRLGTPIPPIPRLTPPPGLLITASEEPIGMNGGVGGERCCCCCWRYAFTVVVVTNGLEEGVDGKGYPFA